MPYKKMLFQRSLDVIIDGISMSEARADRAQVGLRFYSSDLGRESDFNVAPYHVSKARYAT